MKPAEQMPIYIGAMSGTSLDGLDLVAVSFDDHSRPTLLASECHAYSSDLRQDLRNLIQQPATNLADLGQTDTRLGRFYADSIDQFCTRNRLDKSAIRAVGSHGQTIWHSPDGPAPFTLQIGDPNIIAAQTGLDVVADFRRRDIALGGQGAPFACAYHEQVFRSDDKDRVIINIGGIANITYLPSDPSQPVIGFDSGPGNTFMDAFSRSHLGQDYDDAGAFARQGSILHDWLERTLREEPYFLRAHPKSTGTEYFSPAWLERSGLLHHERPADVMATLCELTARSITHAIEHSSLVPDEVFICGGGAHNHFLLQRLAERLAPARVATTDVLGLPPDWVEAITFAWLARQTMDRRPSNLPSVTKAKKFTILGAVYFDRQFDSL